MRTCDVLIVGGGPAGSSAAWKLKQAGADVLVLDKERFPRLKLCAGLDHSGGGARPVSWTSALIRTAS